jgi:exosortase
MSTLDANSLRSAPSCPAPRTAVSPLLREAAVAVALLTAGLLWSYLPTLAALAERWARDPQYSHGFLVPVFALALLWSRRDLLAHAVWKPELWGLPLLLGGLALRQLAALANIDALDSISLLPVLAGLVLLVGGRGLLRWSWPAIAFLAFMLPLPFFLEVSLAHPLRRLATQVSTYTLQTFGCPALAEGNVILVGEARLGVAEACSGLGMLMTFFALATATALVVQAPLVDRLVLVASAAPIAVFANVVRITATGLAFHVGGADSPTARNLFHDLAGWLMMPLALGLLYLEMCFLNRLFLMVPERQPLPLALHRPDLTAGRPAPVPPEKYR